MYVFKYIRPYRWHLIAGLILLFASSLVFMAFPYLAGLMVDVAQGKAGRPMDLTQVGWILLAVLIVQGGISYGRVMLFAQVSEKGIAALRKALYQKLITLPLPFFEQNRSGDLVSRIAGDVEKLYNAFSITIAEFLRQIIILVAGIVFLAITTPQLALIMLLTFPVVVLLAMVFGRRIRALSKQRQKALADSGTMVSEAVQNIQTVKTYTGEWLEINRYGRLIKKAVDISLRYAHARALFSVFIIVLLFGALFFIIWEGANLLQAGKITAGDLISFVSYTAIIGGAIAGLGNFYTDLLGALGATERIREILHTKPEIELNAETEETSTSSISPAKVQGHIRYEEVHFSYPTRPDTEVLRGITLEVKPGQKIALVGPSGAGKSTIVQLLLRFYDPTAGRILLDDKDIREYDLRAYRSHIALVPQEVLLFGGSIRENILYGKPDATEEEVIQAARQANAWEFISGFPDGLDTIVGERGVQLSGGQRQRIAIARAILKDPEILLLDEATSSLDAESERVVQDALDKLMEGRTSIVIAHRLATVRSSDRIYVIEQGRVIEEGTHEELSAIPNGIYGSLARLQFVVSETS
ncbi:MAG TPA: ATP-binding cassette domain-containing protein [Phaeodactylibacter sp.]|nr:ATP-binding cassette domain-containing protein [Phaeodactylibacter sp.]